MVESNFNNIAKLAKVASKKLALLSTQIKYNALLTIAQEIESNKEKIFIANKKDLEEAKVLLENGDISQALYNRLKLDENKMRDMIQGIIDIYELDDPIGKTLLQRSLDTGLVLSKKSCPIGVLGIIFEARPDVISQISALAM